MSLINEQIKELRQHASERKGEIADICNRAADTIEALSEKLRASRYSDDVIQKMQELEQAELQKACEIGRELERMEQETSEDEYIKVPKKALKYRTAGMVAYNAEWLKNHFDIERAVICGAQQPCDVAISKQAAINAVNIGNLNPGIVEALQSILAELPPVIPQPKIGKWIKSRDSYGNNHFTCPFCEHDIATKYVGIWKDNYCSNCGAKMEEVEE